MTKTTYDYIDRAIGELVQPVPDIYSAIGLLTVARLTPSEPQMTAERFVRENPTTLEELPPMRQLKTKVTALDVPCPTCNAKPHKRCVRMSNRGASGVPTDEPLLSGGSPSSHKRRSDRAKALNN